MALPHESVLHLITEEMVVDERLYLGYQMKCWRFWRPILGDSYGILNKKSFFWKFQRRREAMKRILSNKRVRCGRKPE
ncbi:hypothetical protein [Desulfovibrio inopinatus]|uniref:hypothetical protein n=1 Tax=Desulfovibrio inopinatus TaxID=102109 RepID=UPI00048048CD|nr:hypothetical protein [Desulfovibrio inopinatus]